MLAERYLDFKTGRQRSEWQSSRLHPALGVIVLAAARWHWLAKGEPSVVTALLRTPDEQRAIYPASPGRRSPHEFGRAADLRVTSLAAGQAQDWAHWLNEAFAYSGRNGLKTALIHEVGGRGQHLHLQVGPGENIPPVQET
jgi:hypothetical protein